MRSRVGPISAARRSLLAAALAATAVGTPAPQPEAASQAVAPALAPQQAPAARTDTTPVRQSPSKALRVNRDAKRLQGGGMFLPSRVYSPIWVGYERARRSWS